MLSPRNHGVSFHRDRFFNSCCLFRQRFVDAYLLKLFVLPQFRTCSCYSFPSGVTNLSLLVGVCAACILAYRCLQMKWWAAVTVVAIRSSKALLMCPYVSYGKFSVLAPRCSCALLHNLQPTPDHCVIFASHLATGMNPAIAIISRFLCLQGTRVSFEYFPTNPLLSFCSDMKSDSQCCPRAMCSKGIDVVLLCFGSHTQFSRICCHQSKCFAARPSPCCSTIPHIVACVCSPLCHLQNY